MKGYYEYGTDSGSRWLGDDTPYSIGGHSTDLTSLGFCLRQRLKEVYPVNGVPEAMEAEIAGLVELLTHGDFLIQRFIEMVAEDLAEGR